MSEIKALKSLTGTISEETSLFGVLSCDEGLTGQLSTTTKHNEYVGPYEVVPQAFNAQTLQTAFMLLNDDIVVSEIPYFDVGNESDGSTIYIGSKID